jgi:SAM-dependent methyltransferase
MNDLIEELKQFPRRRHRLEVEDQYVVRTLSEYGCGRVLDVGCGTGRLINQLPMPACGIDWNMSNLAQVGRGGVVLQGNALALPFADRNFDGVHCSHLIEHFCPSDAYQALSELGRVTQIDGLLVIRTPVLWRGFYDDLTHIRPYNPKVFLRYLCQEGGQRTFRAHSFQFELVKLRYRYLPLIYFDRPVGWRVMAKALADWICRFHLHSLKCDAYTLVLRRLR